jgi:hypothetical protein
MHQNTTFLRTNEAYRLLQNSFFFFFLKKKTLLAWPETTIFLDTTIKYNKTNISSVLHWQSSTCPTVFIKHFLQAKELERELKFEM